MKTSTEFPGVYRVRLRERCWWRLERLELGIFTYKWRLVENWLHEPTKAEVAEALEQVRNEDLEQQRVAAFRPYFVTAEAEA